MQKKWIIASLITVSVALSHCSTGRGDDIDLKLPKASLRLADGSPISQPGVDDYNPTLVIKDDGYGVLIFGSNRTYAGQTGGTKHNLFIAQTVAPYYGFGPVPYFQSVTVLKSSGSALDKTARIPFVARFNSSSQTVDLIFTDPATNNLRMTGVTDANISTGTLSTINNFQGPGVGQDRTGTLLGAVENSDGSVQVLYRAQDNSLVMADPYATLPTTDDSLSNNQITSDSSVALFPDWVAGAKSYFYTNWNSDGTDGGEVFAANNDSPVGAPGGLNDALFEAGLSASYIRTYHQYGSGVSGFVFSAGTSLNSDQDMYVVTSHDLYGLWAMTYEDPDYFPADVFQDLPPIFFGGYMESGNTYFELYMDQPVFADNLASSPVTASQFNFTFVQNGGTATNATVSAVQDITGSATSGGEMAFKISVSVTGTPDGSEYIMVTPTDGSSIFSYTGLAMGAGETAYVYLNPPPPPPTFTFSNITGNAYVEMYFSSGVYSDFGTSTPVTAAGFSVTYADNGGCVSCSVSIASVTQLDTSALVGGETAVRANLSISGGVPTGIETIEITPANGTAIQNSGLSYMSVSETTGPMYLSSGPQITNITQGLGNAFVQVDFSEPIWTDSANSLPVTPSDFTVVFTANGGCSCTVGISSVTLANDDVLVGGEGTIKFHLSITGTPTGVEEIAIKAAADSSVYGANALGISNSEQSANVTLRPVPLISSATVAADNSYIDVNFDSGIWTEDSNLSGVIASDFSLNFVPNAGCGACSVSIASTQNTSGGGLSGGESSVRLTLNISGGTITGAETIEVKPVISEIYGSGGAASPNSTSTGVKSLNAAPLPPLIVSAAMASDDSYMTVTFDKAVYGASGNVGPITTAAFKSPNYIPNAGCAVCAPVTISSVTNTVNSVLTGGETAVRVHFNYNAVAPFNGSETMELQLNGNTVFNGTASTADGHSTGLKALFPFGGGGNKRVFVTANTTNAGFGGVAQADTFCNSAPNRPNASTYKALIAVSGVRQVGIDWPLLPSTPYDRAAGGTIGATDGTGVFPFPVSAGGFGTGQYWTGMTASWAPSANHCVSWTYSLAGNQADIGDASLNTANLISNGTSTCDLPKSLVCVEQ